MDEDLLNSNGELNDGFGVDSTSSDLTASVTTPPLDNMNMGSDTALLVATALKQTTIKQNGGKSMSIVHSYNYTGKV